MNIKKLDFDSIYINLYELNIGIYAAISEEKLPFKKKSRISGNFKF
jgi:hypothetical protein